MALIVLFSLFVNEDGCLKVLDYFQDTYFPLVSILHQATLLSTKPLNFLFPSFLLCLCAHHAADHVFSLEQISWLVIEFLLRYNLHTVTFIPFAVQFSEF